MIILNGVNSLEMERIHDGSFPLPLLGNYIAGKTIIDNGEIVAIGLLKVTTEATLICNKDVSNIYRIKALKALIEELEKELKYRHILDCHIFAKDIKVINILKRLGFIPCEAGEAMVIQV